ncbi:ARM repeat-containing protein [Ceratobasidium sp. AG-I]|nr:ARM repeat-containing protein [Ceratobasidium sp. AG-I]
MGYTLDKSDKQSIQKYLDVLYAVDPDEDAVANAASCLSSLIEQKETVADLDLDGNNNADKEAALDDHDKIFALKQHILATKPDLFKHLTSLPEDPYRAGDSSVLLSKGRLIAEMLRDVPSNKSAFMPYIDQLLRPTFTLDPDERIARLYTNMLASYPIGELLRPDPNAEDAHRAVVEALSREVKELSVPLDISASAMTERLVSNQNALACGLQCIAGLPLQPDALPAFIEAGGLDALLDVVMRGPLSLPGEDYPNGSLRDACSALASLMEDSSSEALAEALVVRQAAIPLVKQMSYICGLEYVDRASDVPRTLPFLAKWNQTLRTQIISEAQRLSSSDSKDLAPGAVIVLWGLIDGAQACNIDEITKFAESEKYVPFFLTPCEPGVGEAIMKAAINALALQIGQPGDQLGKGIATPEMVEKLVNLLEFDTSSSMPILRALVLPTSQEGAEGTINLDEDSKRTNKPFCQMFSKAIKARCEAIQALASKNTNDREIEATIQEPSEEGQANMKNVNMLKVLVEEQHIAMALLAGGLLDYQQYLLSSPSPLTRRAGLNLLNALCHDSSPMKDFEYVPGIIDTFKPIVVRLLDDSRALIRALALKWLSSIMGYRHPKSENPVRYQPGIDFVMEYVTEKKLVAMLKRAGRDATAAAKMIGLMARFSTGSDVQNRLKTNQELMELLWNGAFGVMEQASPGEDEDISEGIWDAWNTENPSGQALFEIFDPVIDCAIITSHILPRLERLTDKEPPEFAELIGKLPEIASPAVFTPEIGVLSRLSEMITNEEQLPYAMTSLRSLAQGSMLAKVTLGQSDHIYPALVKILREGTEDSKNAILDNLYWIIDASTVSRTRFMKEGGIKALLDIICSNAPSDDSRLSGGAASTLVSFLTNFPEGAQFMVDAGGIPILESKKDNEDMSYDVGRALSLLEEYRAAPAVERFEFTPQPYAVFGREQSDLVALERLKQNLESSQDEKQLAIVGGLPGVLTDLVRSSSEPKPLLQILQTLLVANGLGWGADTVALRAVERCGLWEALEPFVEGEEKEVSDLVANIRGVLVPESRSDNSGREW